MRVIRFALVAIFLAYTPNAHSQTPAIQQDALRQNERLQRHQRDEQLERERDLRAIQPPAPILRDAKQEDAAAAQASDVCLPIKTINFKHATLFSSKQLDKLKPGRNCLGLPDIAGLVRAVTNLYVEEGYVTSRAYLPEQDLSSGTLTLEIVEGRVEAIQLIENDEVRTSGSAILPDLTGKILNIRDVEQGLDQINSQASKDAKISFKPADKAGYSIVVVNIQAGKPWQARFSVDNSGMETTGRIQGDATFTFEDLFGQFETLVVTHKRNLDAPNDRTSSLNTQVNLSVPRGFWTWRWSSSFFSYGSEIRDLVQTFNTTGENWSHKGEVERLLVRDRISKTHAMLGLTVKDARNYVDSVMQSSTSVILSVAHLGLSHTRRFAGGTLSANALARQGLPIFGAPDDRKRAYSTKAQFSSISGDLSFYRGWKFGGFTVGANSLLKGQYSPHRLFGSEKLSLGGSSSVRGFHKDNLAAENGFYSRNEISLTLPDIDPGTKKYLGSLSLFAGLDAGWQLPGESTRKERGHVVGTAFGARLQGGVLFGEAAWEKALHAPSWIKQDHVVRFRAGLNLSNF